MSQSVCSANVECSGLISQVNTGLVMPLCRVEGAKPRVVTIHSRAEENVGAGNLTVHSPLMFQLSFTVQTGVPVQVGCYG